MNKYPKKINVSFFDLDDNYYGDTDTWYMISFFETIGFDAEYYDPKKFTKTEVKQLAKNKLIAAEKRSNIKLYLFGEKGKYIISPSAHFFPINFAYSFKDGEFYEPEATFSIDMFYDMPPNELLRKSLLNAGAIELFEKLRPLILPVEKYYQEELELRKIDKIAPAFEVKVYNLSNGISLIRPIVYASLERAKENIQIIDGSYSVITNIKTGEIEYSDKD